MKMTGTMQQMRAVHVAPLELRARMTRETEEYHTTLPPGRDIPWPSNRYGRRAGIGQGANRWERGGCGKPTGQHAYHNDAQRICSLWQKRAKSAG
jgi:hypothetical protein